MITMDSGMASSALKLDCVKYNQTCHHNNYVPGSDWCWVHHFIAAVGFLSRTQRSNRWSLASIVVALGLLMPLLLTCSRVLKNLIINEIFLKSSLPETRPEWPFCSIRSLLQSFPDQLHRDCCHGWSRSEKSSIFLYVVTFWLYLENRELLFGKGSSDSLCLCFMVRDPTFSLDQLDKVLLAQQFSFLESVLFSRA